MMPEGLNKSISVMDLFFADFFVISTTETRQTHQSEQKSDPYEKKNMVADMRTPDDDRWH